MFGLKKSEDPYIVQKGEENEAEKSRNRHFSECQTRTRKLIKNAVKAGDRFVMVSEGYASLWYLFVAAVTVVANEQGQPVEHLTFHTSTSVSFGHGSWEGYALLTLKRP